MEIEIYPNDSLKFISVALSVPGAGITTVSYAKNFNLYDGAEFAGDPSVLLKSTSGLHMPFFKAFAQLTALFYLLLKIIAG